jgi:hypothetical protein
MTRSHTGIYRMSEGLEYATVIGIDPGALWWIRALEAQRADQESLAGEKSERRYPRCDQVILLKISIERVRS